MRAIGVTSPQRFPTVPDIPTLAETGLPGYDVTSWYGLAFAAGTPAPIVEKTNKAMRELLATDAVRAQIVKVGALVNPRRRRSCARTSFPKSIDGRPFARRPASSSNRCENMTTHSNQRGRSWLT